MASPQVTVQRSRKRGYAAFLICGLCVALNVLAYLPAQSFEQSEATEFTVTLLLLAVFIISALTGAALAIKNMRDAGLLMLLLVTIGFAFASSYSRSWGWKMRIFLQLSYAILVLTIGTFQILAIQRQPR
jgi:uncharacterized membrane protein YhaH (DUF805 family)